MELIADTTVLIDLWRCRKHPRRLDDLHRKVGPASLILPWIVEAEFSRGAILKNVPLESLDAFYKDFLYAGLTRESVKLYAQTWAQMARMGLAPHYPDLWIATTALERNCPLVTRNPAHFEPIPALQLIAYQLPPS